MAKVPYRSTPEVTLQDTPMPYFRSHADAESMGAGVGKAVQGLGQQLQKTGDVFAEHALKEQALENEAHSKELFLWADMQMGQATVDYNSLEGKNKYDAYEGYVKQLEGIRQQGIEQAGNNPAVRRMFDNQFTGRMATSIVSGASGAAAARKKYESDASSARVDNAVSDTAANWQDDGRFQQNLGIVHQEVDSQARLHGWDPATIQKEKLEQTSKVWTARIQSMARTDPFTARKVFEENKDQISGLQQIQIDKHLQGQDVNVGTRIFSDQIMQGKEEPSIPEPPAPRAVPKAIGPRSDMPPPGKVGAIPEQKARPDQYAGKLLLGTEHFDFATGGGKTPSIPYGTYPITPSANGPIVSALGGYTLNNNALYDPKLGRDRLGIAIHPATGSGQVSAGCIVIPDNKWAAFRTMLERKMATEGQQYVTVNPDGSAFISSRPGELPGSVDRLGADYTKPDPQNKSLPVAVRTNNPGNQWMGASAKKFGALGYADVSARDQPAIFPDKVSGAAAMFDLLGSGGYAGKTVEQAIYKWAAGTNPAYPKYIEETTGIPRGTVITRDFLSSPDGIKLAKAMARYEAGTEKGDYPLSNPGWQEAQRMAFGTKTASLDPSSGISTNPVQTIDPDNPAKVEATQPVDRTDPAAVAAAGGPEALGTQIAQADKDVLGPLTAESGADWLERALDRGRDWARKYAPNNPQFEDQLLARIETDYNRMKRVKTQTERSNYQDIMRYVMGDYNENMIRSLDVIYGSPSAMALWNKLTTTQQKAVEAQVKRNSKADVVETPERFQRYQELMGVSVTNPEKFLSMTTNDYGDLPRARQSAIIEAQRNMAKKVQNNTRLNAYLRTVNTMVNEAGIVARRDDPGSMALYNQFIGASQEKLNNFIDREKRFPSEEEQMQIAAGLLKEQKTGFLDYVFGGSRVFEIPNKWVDPTSGKSYSKDEWAERFRQRVGREPTPQDMSILYQRSIGRGGQQ